MNSFILYSYEFKGIKVPDTPIDFSEWETINVDESVAKKQEIFGSFFEKENFQEFFRLKNRIFRCRLNWQYNGVIVMQIECKHKRKKSENFVDKTENNYPWCYVIIDNRKNIQHITIQKNTSAFSATNTVAKIIEYTLNQWLINYRLQIHITPKYRSKVFWELIDKYKTWGIKRILFKFAYSNADWATRMVKNLEEYAHNSNGAVRLGVEAAENEILDFQKTKKNKDMVNVCSGLGADIEIKVKGLRTIHTLQEMNPVEVEMKDSVYNKINTMELFDGNYEETAEFLNKCKPYYDVQ